MALHKFRFVGGRDQGDPKTLAELRRRARPLHRYWLRKVEQAVIAGRLLPIDLMLAKELTNYPSANEGRCYAGQTRLGLAIGRTPRTARQSLKRMREDGLLLCKRGGPGRTASWSFCFKHTPIFGGDPKDAPAAPLFETSTVSALDRKSVSGLDRQCASAKPCEPDPDIERKPPPTPANGDGGTIAGLPTKEARPGIAIDGEVIVGEISFQEFWMAAGRKGAEGFARSEWRKLTVADKAAIADRLERDGRLSVHNLWAGVWLRDRVWEEPQALAAEPLFEEASYVNVVAQPNSDLWNAHREWLLSTGQDRFVKWMDNHGRQGKSITVRVPRGGAFSGPDGEGDQR